MNTLHPLEDQAAAVLVAMSLMIVVGLATVSFMGLCAKVRN